MKTPHESSSPGTASACTHGVTVAGDIFVDHHIYEGERSSPTLDGKRGVRVVREHGGAQAITKLLREMQRCANRCAEEKNADEPVQPIPFDATWEARLGITAPPLSATPCKHHAYAVWKPHLRDPDDAQGKDRVWRADKVLGYGHDSTDAPAAQAASGPQHCDAYGAAPAEPAAGAPPTRILVLDDAGFQFRHAEQRPAWLLPDSGADAATPERIVLKMSRPVAQGDLWRELLARFSDRLIVVVAASELRSEWVALSRGLSWESTVEDVRRILGSAPVLRDLARCRDLVITFSADGALWIDQSDTERPEATLVFDAAGGEGQWAQRLSAHGEAFGYLSCMTAAITRALMEELSPGPALAPPTATKESPREWQQRVQSQRMVRALRAGLAAMRDLRAAGHGPAHEEPSGFPAERLARVLVQDGGDFAAMPVPWGATHFRGTGGMLRLVEVSQRPLDSPSPAQANLHGLARQVVLRGLGVLKTLPHGRFGDLTTADRAEIEALRTIERLMLEYREQHTARKPLSIGVFGPPGAGKSFGVKQLAQAIFGRAAWHEFNLSQFKDVGDLIGAFHALRDAALSGLCPVAFWDEFDSRGYQWLQYLLAPMQDGRFQEGLANHALGRGVFIFAGGTSFSFQEFGPGEAEGAQAQKDFRLCKGPDFQSRLDAFYNVPGPNAGTLPPKTPDGRREPDPADVCAPLRRAIVIRFQLGVARDAILDFDSDLLDALLATDYAHGARSVEKVVAALRPARGSVTIRRSSLPPAQTLAMHLDLERFMAALAAHDDFYTEAGLEARAAALHAGWLKTSRESEEGRKQLSAKPHMNRDWADLEDGDQEANRAAARRIPENLAIAGLKIVQASRETAGEVLRHLRHHLDRIAESEHDGWMAERERNGWRYGEARDDQRKLHPCLVPYGQLPEIEKNKDRDNVMGYPKLLHASGYEIVFAGAESGKNAVPP